LGQAGFLRQEGVERSTVSSAVPSQEQQQQQRQLEALTGRAGKNALPTREGGNELGREERPG
jgi:hypothetical protein